MKTMKGCRSVLSCEQALVHLDFTAASFLTAVASVPGHWWRTDLQSGAVAADGQPAGRQPRSLHNIYMSQGAHVSFMRPSGMCPLPQQE